MADISNTAAAAEKAQLDVEHTQVQHVVEEVDKERAAIQAVSEYQYSQRSVALSMRAIYLPTPPRSTPTTATVRSTPIATASSTKRKRYINPGQSNFQLNTLIPGYLSRPHLPPPVRQLIQPSHPGGGLSIYIWDMSWQVVSQAPTPDFTAQFAAMERSRGMSIIQMGMQRIEQYGDSY